MDRRIVLLIAVLIFALLALAGGGKRVYSAEFKADIKHKVTAWDMWGRVEAVETYANAGMCTSRIVYEDGVPQIYVVAQPTRRAKQINRWTVMKEKRAILTTDMLKQSFADAIREYCLPSIIGTTNT